MRLDIYTACWEGDQAQKRGRVLDCEVQVLRLKLFGVRQKWPQIPGLPIISYVTLGKSPSSFLSGLSLGLSNTHLKGFFESSTSAHFHI